MLFKMILIALLAMPSVAIAEEKIFKIDESLQDEFKEVAKDLRCPTCTGLSVLESNATFSVQIKTIVKEKIEAGENKEKILSYFTERYGPWILREPPKSGFNLIAWAFPIGLMIFGPFVVYLLVWRRKKVSSSMGVRHSNDILKEMEQKLIEMRGV
jgi:cytochrome c-type biogenesis protein CcmH/NrfF